MDSKDLIIAALHKQLGGGTVVLTWEEMAKVRHYKIHVNLTSNGHEITAECDDGCIDRGGGPAERPETEGY